MRHCIVHGCNSKLNFHEETEKISLFKFPVNPNTREAWINALQHSNNQSLASELNDNCRICEKHFKPEDINQNKCRSSLSKMAVPTIFPNSDGLDTEYLLLEESENANVLNVLQLKQKENLEPSKSLNEEQDRIASDEVAGNFLYCENCGHANSTKKNEVRSDVEMLTAVNRRENGRKRRMNDEPLSTPTTPKKFFPFTEYKVQNSVDTSYPNGQEQIQNIQNQDQSPCSQDQIRSKFRPKRLHFPGDVPSDVELTPKSSKRFISSLKKIVITQRRRIKVSAQKVRRQQKKILSLKGLLEDLKKKNMVSENAVELLQCGDESIMKTIEKGRLNNEYPPEVRRFALTLHFYSPRAYRYVRNKFKNKLPAPRTIRKWCESVNGDPGITKEALNVLSVKIKDFQDKGQQLRFCMAIDEMSIRKQIEFNFAKKKYFGYVDFGGNDIKRDHTIAATKAWVILLTALNANFKIPVAYYLTNGLNAKEQAGIVNGILRVLHENNVLVVALVFDGAATNVSMVNLNRKMKNPTHFNHPVTNDRIEIIWDVCHMLKLVRNTLASKKILHDAQGRPIEWRYIRMLHELQEKHRIRLGNRLTKQHVQFSCKKMNVRLAAQTLSGSVADALEVLQEKNPDFKNCGPTITFIRTFNRLFDMCNSKSKFGKYDKRPIDSSSAKETFEFFDTAAKYILRLKLHKRKIINTKSYTGFFGFLQSMSAIHNLYNDHVKNGPMEYLLTFKLSQDHLETFFASIRSRHGFNNNPNAIQFRSAYKQLIIHNEISSPSSANCIPVDNTSVLTISSTSKIIAAIPDDKELYDPSILSKDFKNAIASHGLHDVVSDAVVYIAGFVERSIRRKLICQSCSAALDENPMIGGGVLIDKKNFGKHGGLCTPRQAVVVLCRLAEKNIQLADEKKQFSQSQMYISILNKCFRDVPPKLLSNMEEHVKECDPLENHRYLLIRSILEEYLKVKLNYIGKLQTMEMHSNFIRSKTTKLVQFHGQ